MPDKVMKPGEAPQGSGTVFSTSSKPDIEGPANEAENLTPYTKGK
jgi:hypothetical protein